MAITFIQSVGEQQSKVSTHTTLAVTVPAGGVAAGNLLAVAVAMNDDAGTVSVADTGLNTYAVVTSRDGNTGSLSNSGTARCILLLCKVTTALVSGNTITVTHPATVASACVIGEFAGAGLTSQYLSNAFASSTFINDGTNFIVGTGNSVLLMAAAVETPNEALTANANLDAMVGDLGTTGGGAASNMLSALAYKINPTNITSAQMLQANSRNYAAISVVLAEEVSPIASQPSNPSCTNDAAIGTVAWGTPTNAAQSNNNRASITLLATQTSNYLKTLAYNINIPSGNTIQGIQVDIECYESAISTQLLSVRLVIGGTIQTGHTKTLSLPNGVGAEAYLTVGDANDLWGQSSISLAQAMAADFGVVMYVDNAIANTFNIDHVRIQVYYGVAAEKIGARPFGYIGQSFLSQIIRR